MKMCNKYIDIGVITCISFLISYSIVILIIAYMQGENIGSWIWDRHQHPFSWYSRPIFIIVGCYYAYRRKLFFIFSIILLLFSSLFWFPAPESIPQEVSGYLQWEKELFFSNDNKIPLLLLSLVVVFFFYSLFASFWKRSYIAGIIVINTGTILKVFVSLLLDTSSGFAVLAPAISSLLIVNIFAYFIGIKYGIFKKKK